MQSMTQSLYQNSRYTMYVLLCVQYESKKGAKIRNRYNQVPHLTQDTKWESNNHILKHHKREPKGQPF